MSVWINSILQNADYFLLIMLRVGGLVFTSPIFGRKLIPNIVKIGLTVSLSFLFFTFFPVSSAIEYSTLFGFFLICASELLMGVALAFVTNMFFSLVYIGGHMIDMQIGFGIVNVYDIQNNTQIPLTGNLLNVVLLITFFGVDGHHQLIRIIYLTVEQLPIGSLAITAELGTVMLKLFINSFLLGVMVAIPIVASGLVLEICFGLLVRTVPQINMFVVGLPVKIFVGFIILIFTLPVFMNFTGRIFSEMFAGIEQVFSTFARSA